ncbi:hypothetical protein FS837_006379 [Tulasnella sp. UAMH 9824]|nr:hypothetical protein FS837_006379 [Tulasnella sp. UAMH 9824]
MEASTSPSSMREILSIPLAQFETLTNQLFVSLSTVTPTAASYAFSNSLTAPDVESFVQCEAALAEALNQARLHQIKQRRIEQLKEEIVSLDWRLNGICEQLKRDKSGLEDIIREAEVRVKAIDRTEKAYAQNLTNSTSAPLMDTNPGPDQLAPPAFQGPYPDDAKLRQGSLGRSGARLTEPVGEARIVGEPAPSPLGPARAPAPSAADTKRHPGHYRPPPAAIPDFGLDLSDD